MQSIEDLIEGLVDPDADCSTGAKKTLVSLGPAVIDHLTRTLAYVPDRHKWKIIQTLSEIGDSRAVPALVPYLDAESAAIRAAVAQFLGTFGGHEAVEPLLHILANQDNKNSLVWVIQALGRLKDRRAVRPLIRAMDEAESAPVRYTAIEALAQVGDYQAVEAIKRYVDDPDHHVRAHAEKALQTFHAQQ